MVAYSQKLAITFNIFDTVISKPADVESTTAETTGHDGLLKIVYALTFRRAFASKFTRSLGKRYLLMNGSMG